jgi:hypothetical protein
MPDGRFGSAFPRLLVVGAAPFSLFVFGALGAIAGREVRRRRQEH